MRGRKKKPSIVRKLMGNAGHRPIPAHEPEPIPGMPPCPDHLGPDAKKEWALLGPQMVAEQRMAHIYSGVLALYCVAYGRWVEAEQHIAQHGINFTNLTKMFARLHPASVSKSVWVANSSTIPQLTILEVGAGNTHVPVLRSTEGGFEILTRPVIFTEKTAALGTVGDIMLCDFSQYAVGLRKEVSVDRSQHVGFTRDTVYYRGTLRADGRPTWLSAVTPKNGGDTLSPFVTLATRA